MMLRDIQTWFERRMPEGWFVGPPEVTADEVEILVVGDLAEPDGKAAGACEQVIAGWREASRERRMQIADEAERRFRRKVAWGARCGDARRLFTTYSVPVMTRLRLPERSVLDTLVESGVARTRSDALAWCVRLVGEHESEWLQELRDALVHVQEVRAEGPRSSRKRGAEGGT